MSRSWPSQQKDLTWIDTIKLLFLVQANKTTQRSNYKIIWIVCRRSRKYHAQSPNNSLEKSEQKKRIRKQNIVKGAT